MNVKQYVSLVAETVASLGHRDNVLFQKAAAMANDASTWPYYTPALQDRAVQCRDLIHDGLQAYVPGAMWFDTATAKEYAALVTKFNLIS